MKTILIVIPAAVITAILTRWLIARRKLRAHFANVGEGTRETGHTSYLWDSGGATANAAALAAAATSAGRFLLVKNTTDGDHITVCGALDTPVAICEDAYDVNNSDVPVSCSILGAGRTVRVVTDGTIANGNPVTTGATGFATAATTGQAGIFGRANFGSDTTSAAGDVITVITTVPFKYAF
jgi:hypothetical protein